MALFERTRSGKGQVVDASMVSGSGGPLIPPVVPKDDVGLPQVLFKTRIQVPKDTFENNTHNFIFFT